MSYLRPDSDESDHVTGYTRKPKIYLNCATNVFRDKIPDTTGRILFHPLHEKRAGVIMHREGMLYASDDDALNE